MNNLVPRNQPAGAVVPAADAATSLIDRFQVWEEGRQFFADRLPTKDEAQVLRKRLGLLDTYLRPMGGSSADKEAVKQALAVWFLGYPSMQNADATGMIAAYMTDLRSLPVFAIVRTLEDVKAGRMTEIDRNGREVVVGNDWPPASPRIYSHAVKVMTERCNEQIKIRKLMSAKPARPEMDTEDRAEVAARVRKMADDAKRKLGVGDAATIAARDAADRRRAEQAERSRAAFELDCVEEYAQLGLEVRRIGGFIVSPELAAKMDPFVRGKLKSSE